MFLILTHIWILHKYYETKNALKKILFKTKIVKNKFLVSKHFLMDANQTFKQK